MNFTVEPGEVLGFLGPNGAGKSTTMKMLAGFLAPTSGSASVCGHDVENDAARRQARARLPARRRAELRRDDACARFLDFIADVRGLRARARATRLDDVIAAAAPRARCSSRPIETLSKGFKRRVGLAQAILHDPPVLILDEPTDGLDPNQKHEVRTLINAMARDKTIVISTHILEEVDAVCTRAIIIARAASLADDTPAELEARSRYHQAVSLTAEHVAARRSDALARVADVAASRSIAQDGRITAFPKPGRAILAAVSERLDAAGHRRARTAPGSAGASTRCSAPITQHEPARRHAMSNVVTVFARELASYFATPLAYVFIVIFLVLAGVLHLLPRRLLRARPGRPAIRSSTSIRGCTCSWCRRSRCGCGPRSASPARSSCC